MLPAIRIFYTTTPNFTLKQKGVRRYYRHGETYDCLMHRFKDSHPSTITLQLLHFVFHVYSKYCLQSPECYYLFLCLTNATYMISPYFIRSHKHKYEGRFTCVSCLL